MAEFAPLRSSSAWGGRATRAEVDLDAIAHNIRAIQRKVSPAQVMAVVKADGYGHGAAPVARAALAAGATRLAVYTLDEGVALRQAGIEAPVLVFGPFCPGEVDAVWTYRLTPTVTGLSAAELLARHASGDRLPVHVKVDTGLTRAGASPDDVPVLMRALATIPSLDIEGIYTHLACADTPDHAANGAQLSTFGDLLQQLQADGIALPLRHAANSAGALNLPDARFDLVRPGIAMYGYDPSPGGGHGVRLRPALSLASCITRLTRIPAGTGVGYGHTYHSSGVRTIALVPAGYGDGVSRTLGRGVGRVLVRGQLAPIVGRISMDQITVDVTDIPGAALGDEVVLIGPQDERSISADDWAAALETISYEVLTGVATRVPRLYVENGELSAIRPPYAFADVPYVAR